MKKIVKKRKEERKKKEREKERKKDKKLPKGGTTRLLGVFRNRATQALQNLTKLEILAFCPRWNLFL